VDCWQPVNLIAEGTWTTVYLARPLGCPDDSPADYAVKVVKEQYADDRVARKQMQREAIVGKTVSHPNLISVLSSHIDKTPCYIVMPHLEGITLAKLLLKQDPICLPQALWIARQTAEAMSAVHLAGWMHADVKPANIFVSPQGHATLIDLGFARSFEAPNEKRGEMVGTMNYAAPELFIDSCGRNGQSDIYSLGVTLYEMLTGRLPFIEEDACELALAHLREPPRDPRTLAPNLPPRLVRLLNRMLAKEPLRRPEAQELVSILMELEIETFDER
jgi:serine/threonine-protein kinase